MKTFEVVRAWGKILKGERPSLSIEITRECPLRCPGCYAYDDHHLGGGATLRGLRDLKGQALIDGVVKLVDRARPQHLSIVGGDPLVRYRGLEALIPMLVGRGIYVQVVTSAFRALPNGWGALKGLNVVVSIDGLRPEHDVRRAPATYDRILKNIAGQRVTVHCTITGQMMKRPGYLQEFLEFWTPRAEIRKVWFSLFTPQVGDQLEEILRPGGTVAGDRGAGGVAKEISEAGHAGGFDPAVCEAAAWSRRMRVCADDGDGIGRPFNQDRSVPIRGESGLQLVRVYCVDGAGGGGGAQIGGLDSGGGAL